jgi:hypothetical protein
MATILEIFEKQIKENAAKIPTYHKGDVVRTVKGADWNVNGLWDYHHWIGQKATVVKAGITPLSGREFYTLELPSGERLELELDYLDLRIKSEQAAE